MEPLSREQSELAAEAAKRAEAIAKRYARLLPMHDADLRSAAMLGVVRAAANFKPERCTWRAWSDLLAKRAIQDYLRSAHVYRWKCHVGHTPDDPIPYVEGNEGEVEAKDFFERELPKLPKNQAKVMSVMARDGVQPDVAAASAGYSPNYGFLLFREASENLRGKFAV